MCMKTIGINKALRDMIDDFSKDGETINMSINRLLDTSLVRDLDIDGLHSHVKTNIGLSEDTFNKLKSCRLYDGESSSSVILRLLYAYSLLQGGGDDDV